MSEWIFDLMSTLQSRGISLVALVLGLNLLVLFITTWVKVQETTPGGKYLFVIVGCFGTMLLILWVSVEVPSDFKNYPVGSCFKEQRSIDYKELKRNLEWGEKQVAAATKALDIAKKMNASNVAGLEQDLKRDQEYLEWAQRRLNSPAELSYVVVSSQPKQVLAFSPEISYLDTSFKMDTSKHKIPCTKDLERIVMVYEQTGKLVSFKE